MPNYARAALALLAGCASAPAGEPGMFRFEARRGAERMPREWKASETAVIVCDMWDNHWCRSAARRTAELAPRVDAFVRAARARGALIVHAPSDVVAFYEGTPPRRRAREAPEARPPVPIQARRYDPSREGPFPVDDSDNGCDDDPPCPVVTKPPPWTRQIAAIDIAPEDAVTDRGQEVYNLFAQRGVRHVFMTGVHTNMCVLGRSFAIRQLVLLGFDVVLVRDLTDSLYNPRRRPFVSHDRGTELIVEHIEKYWCPSTTAAAVLR
ncbi:MAG TPA: isochorismatase family protein [Planctomycetota bacterium]|jgi:nicotinamidase-related amidase|nr:isochorismatase family protein [Planctomycetota bacterium]